MIRWLRVVLPPGWVLVLIVLICMAIQAYLRFLEWVMQVDFYSMPDMATGPVLMLTAAAYAIYRVCVFHPVLRPGYFDWLRSTPWTSDKPLPLGPIHLIWQDLVILGVGIAALVPLLEWRAVYLLQAFLMAYLLSLAAVHNLTGEKLWSYAIGFGVGWLVLFWADPEYFFPTALACYGLAWAALRRSLARFPWEDTLIHETHDFLRVSFSLQKRTQSLGWPYDQMGPEFADFHSRGVQHGLTKWRDVFLMGLLLGWWSFVGGTSLRRLDPMSKGTEYPLYYLCLCFAVGGRVGIYCNGYVPPLNLLGRLAHLRIIIPGYDKVFVAPLLAVLVGVAAGYVPRCTGIDAVIIIALAVTLDWCILLGMGPSLKSWRLTGNHRIVRSPFQKDMVRTG